MTELSKPLGQSFYEQPTVKLARALLGKVFSYNGMTGKIIETEAYLYRDDPGCHAHRGKTKRNAVMFESAGHVYVYLIYGMYHCINVVSGKEGEGEAVLIRALEPLDGIDKMMKNRKCNKIENLCSGPGKLTQAFGITKKHNGTSFIFGAKNNAGICIYDNKERMQIAKSTRIGLSAGRDLELRFFVPSVNA